MRLAVWLSGSGWGVLVGEDRVAVGVLWDISDPESSIGGLFCSVWPCVEQAIATASKVMIATINFNRRMLFS